MLVLLLWFGLVPKGQAMKMNPVKLVIGTMIGVLLFVMVFPFILMFELFWRMTPHVKTSKRVIALAAQFESEVTKINLSTTSNTAAFEAVAALARQPHYKELVQRRSLYLGIMTIASYLLPPEKFKKDEFVVGYFAQMGAGLLTGRPKQLHISNMFAKARCASDVATALIYSGSLVEEDFRRHFANTNPQLVRDFLAASIEEVLAMPNVEKYKEPGPCG